MTGRLLEVNDLSVTFPTDGGDLHAVRGLSYHVAPREVVAMVGESGSGKSAAAMAVIGLLPEYAEVSGSVLLDGQELLGMGDAEMSRIRGMRIGTVFQDPMSALTPVYTVGDQIAEAIRVHHRDVGKQTARRRATELLDLVGIAQPEQRARAFPHELSGGERQRVVIAIAIANDPDLLICDEPTTALDVTVQAQILDVLRTARDVTGAGVLIVYLLSGPIVTMFITDPPIIELTQHLLHIVLWSTVVFGMAVVFSSMMRSSGTVLAPTAIGIFSILAVEVPVAMYLSGAIGIDGVWWAYPSAFCAMFVLQGSFFMLVWRKRSVRALV